MAKKYHQSARDKYREHSGMERELHGYHRGGAMQMHGRDGEYAGMHARRHQEMQDAGMIHEDHHEIANMPQHVMMKPWPASRDYVMDDYGLDDTIRGIEHQRGLDAHQMRKNLNPKKV